MSHNQEDSEQQLTVENVSSEIQRRPHIFLELAQNALTVAESMRGNYFKNTATFITDLRRVAKKVQEGTRDEPILTIDSAKGLKWEDLRGEVVTFIDGGIGQVQVASNVPILLRVGSYQVKTGEKNIKEREQFGYYPVILGDLEGGNKDRKDFIDIVRITAELLGGLAALRRQPDLRLLMFHGPLVYTAWHYMGHTPFTESDIDRFLSCYSEESEHGRELKEKFFEEAKILYPQMVEGDPQQVQRISQAMLTNRLFEPLAWMSFLYRYLISEAKKRTPVPLIMGVVERGRLREFSERVLLARVFENLEHKGKTNYFNDLFGRTDLNRADALLNRLGYTDSLLLSMLLLPGQFSEPWIVDKFSGFRGAKMVLNGESEEKSFNWRPLKPPAAHGFPMVSAAYLCVNEVTEPIRVEVFTDLGPEQLKPAIQRACLYSSLLPGYGFPVGLDVADKHAKVPAWLTGAYAKIIKHHLGVSLQQGDISDAEMRRLMVQALYMINRDWLYRPTV